MLLRSTSSDKSESKRPLEIQMQEELIWLRCNEVITGDIKEEKDTAEKLDLLFVSVNRRAQGISRFRVFVHGDKSEELS